MKVLVAEDSRYYQKVLQDTLNSWGYTVVMANNGIEALEKLSEEDGPKLAIIDWVMPHVDGLEVCQKIREMVNRGYIYLILLTVNASKEDVVRGLEAGADDYIIKPFNEMELKFRLKTGERIINLEDQIMQLALTDPLTGLLNRRAFIDRLESEINRYQRLEESLSLIMVDLDDFKKVNDNYGHLVGDEVLKGVAKCFSSILRKYDFIGRYGGEEFVICLPGVKIKQAGEIAERLRRGMKELIVNKETEPLKLNVTASFGVSTLGENTFNVHNLTKKADEALYVAKTRGKDQVVLSENY
ncbi:MAG: diguanylate cyclase [Clostridia bacterium]|nr:diguanylate cyclase [Clostridia bacterium]